MDAQRFLARILFGSLLSVILTPLHGMNNNPPSPEKNSPPPLVTFNSLSMTDHEKSLQRDEDLKQFMYNRTDDEIEKFRSLVEDCKERGMDNNQIKETLMLFAVDQPRQNRPLTVSFTIQSEEQLLSSQAGKTPVISEDESQPLPQNKFSETPQNKIPQVIKEKQSEKNSSFESNLARDRALQNKQRNELQQQANYERGRSQSAQNMNRIAHQYDHLVDDPEIKQEIETLAFDFARGYRHELISEYKKNPYNSNNLRGSYITSGAIERAKKLSPVFASKMNQVPEQYKDRSFGQEIAGGFKSAKTGFKYIFDSKFRKEFDNKEKKRKEEKRQRKQWLSNLPSRELTPEPTRLTPAPIPPISNNNSDSQEETDKQESEELEKKEELEQQQQSKNTGQQKQNEAEQNYGQGKGQAEQQHYVSNLENQQQSEEVSKQYENALNQAHEPKQVKSSSFKRIKTKGWRPPLSLARDEDEEGEEQPERNRDPKQILNREEELQKEKENKEKLDREAEAAELQRKKDAEKKASDEAERKKHVEAEHRHEREKINFELQNLRIQYEIAEQERLRKQQEQEFESQLLERQRQKKDAETQKQNAIAEKQEQERAAQEKAKRQKQEEIAEKQRQENALQKARAEAEQQKLIDQKLEQERLENERKHQEFKSLSSCVENVLESVSNAKSFNELNNATQSIERIKGIASDDFVASLSSLVNTQREKINRAERENIKGRADHAKQLILNARSSNEIDEAVQFFESIRDHISDDSIAAFYSQVERQRKKIEKAEVKSQNRSNSNSNSNYDNKESDYGYQSNNYQYSPYQYSEREVEYRISSILTIPHWQRTPRERSFLNEYRHYTDRVYENTCYKLMDILNTNYYDRSEAEDRFVEQYSWIIPKLEQQLNQEFVEYQRANLNHDNWLYGNKIREILRNTSCQPGYLDRMTLSRNPMLTNLIAKEIEIERQQEQDAKEAREASEEFERQRRLQQQRLTQSNSQSQQSQPVQPTQVQSVNQPPTQSQATNPTPRVSQPAPTDVSQPIYVPQVRTRLNARITGNYGDNAVQNRNKERLASIQQTIYPDSKMSLNYSLTTNKNNPAPYRNRFHRIQEGLYNHYPDTSFFRGNTAQIKSHQHQVEILNETCRLYDQQVNKPFESNKNVTVQNISNTVFRYLERATCSNQYQNHERTYALEDFCHAINQTQLSLACFLNGKESRFTNAIFGFYSKLTGADHSVEFGDRLWETITNNSTDENLNTLAWHNNQASSYLARALQNSYPTSEEFNNLILTQAPALLQAYNTNQPNAAQEIVRFVTCMAFYGNGSAGTGNYANNAQNNAVINDIVNAVESENRIAGNRNKNARHYGALRPLATIFSNALQKCLNSAQAAQPTPVQPQPTQPEPVQPPPVQPTIITPPVEPQVEPITTPQDQPQLTTEQIEVTFTTSEPETEQIEVAFTTPEPETEPEPQPTRKKAAPKRKSRRRISSSRKKATPKVRPKRKATNQLDNPRPPKKRRLPKQKGTAPTRKQPSRAAKQKAAPNITCTGSGPSVVDKEPSVDVEMLNDEEEDQRAAQEERDVQLARQLQEDDDMNLEDQQARHTPAVLQNLYNQFQERYLVAQQSQDDFTRERSQQRIDAVTQTMENGGTFDYSNMIDAHPIFTDIDAHVFDQCHGTFIDKQLHQELCLTRTTMHQLLEINPGSARVQAFTPMIDHLTALIKQEEDLANAFGLSDYAHDLVQIIAGGINILNTGIDYAEIGVDATLRGMIRGVQNSFDLQHWKEMGLGLLELGVFFANEAADIEAFDNAMISSVVNNNPDILMDTCKDFEQHYRGHTEVLEQTLQQLKNMTWEQLIENGAQFGTTFVLDGVICHAATLAATKAGRALVNELATALNSGTASERVVEIIGVGKIALEEGPEVANTVVETVKKNPEQLAQEGKNSVQVLKEVADDVTGGTKKSRASSSSNNRRRPCSNV
jgi:hypothetical protein